MDKQDKIIRYRQLKQTARKLSIGAVMGLAIITVRSSGLEIIDSG